MGTTSMRKIATKVGDNQSAIALASTPVRYQRTKQIDIQHLYIRDEVEEKRSEICYVPTAEMLADGLTEPLYIMDFYAVVKQLGMASLTTSTSAAPPPPTSIVQIKEDKDKDITEWDKQPSPV